MSSTSFDCSTRPSILIKLWRQHLRRMQVADLAKLEFISAVWEAAKYERKEHLLAYLRSNKPLTAEDRTYLADYLEGKLKRKRGRPPGGKAALNLRNVAVLVNWYKARLRASGKRYRIHDLAVDAALEYHVRQGHTAPNREALENFLRRSKRRKK
jgi:hypothetical protein